MTGHCFGYNPAGGTRRRVQPGIEPVNTEDTGMGLSAGRAGTHVPGSAKIVPPLHRGKRLFENRLPGDISGDRIPRHDIPDGPWVNHRSGATWSSMTSARYGVVTMVMRIGGDTFSPSHVYSRGNNRPMKSISGMRSFINLPLKRRCCPEVQRSVSPAIAPAIGSFCCLYRSRNRHRDNRDRSGNICHEPPVIYPPARVSNPEYGMFQKLQHLGTLFLFLKSIL